MRCVKIELDRDIKQLNIVPISDWHIGSPKADFRLMQSMVKQIKENENTYCILNGDLIENSTKNSVGDVYECELSPMEQIKTAISILEPIQDKILGATLGNHEARSYKQDGIDLMYFLMSEFSLHDRYDPNAILLFTRFGEMHKGMKETNGSGNVRKLCYSIYATHGSSSGRTAGAKANGLQRMSQIVNADVCLISHTHYPMIFKESSYEIDYRNSCVHEKETLFINSGSALGYGGYAERYSLKPSSKAQPLIILDGTRKYARAIV